MTRAKKQISPDTTGHITHFLSAFGEDQAALNSWCATHPALLLLDLLVQASVHAAGLTSPPATPQIGLCWVVGRGATGAWQGQDDAVAAWTSAGWRFVPAIEGLAVWLTSKGRALRFAAGQWSEAIDVSAVRVGGRQVVGAQQPAIAPPSGGVTPDIQARQTISAILSALSAHGLISN